MPGGVAGEQAACCLQCLSMQCMSKNVTAGSCYFACSWTAMHSPFHHTWLRCLAFSPPQDKDACCANLTRPSAYSRACSCSQSCDGCGGEQRCNCDQVWGSRGDSPLVKALPEPPAGGSSYGASEPASIEASPCNEEAAEESDH